MKLCPTYAEAYNNLADAYENLGEFEQAEKYYKQSANLKPDLFVPLLGLGELYPKIGKYKDSYDAFVGGLEIKPDDTNALRQALRWPLNVLNRSPNS